MHRIDHSTSAVDLFGPGKDGFTEGDPLAEIAPTTVTADHMNVVQEELCNAVEVFAPTEPLLNNQLAATLVIFAELGALNALAHPHVLAENEGGWSSAASDDALTIVLVRDTQEEITDHSVICSDDGGLTWTSGLLPGTRGALTVDWNAGLWIAVGAMGRILTSATGEAGTWTQRTPADSYAASFWSVAWSEELSLWIAVGDARSATAGEPYELQTSPDGITWTARTLPNRTGGISPNPATIADRAGTGRACVATALAIYTSEDGITWDSATLDVALAAEASFYAISDTPSGLMVTSGKFATGTERYAWRSLDGESFTRLPISPLYGYRPLPRSGMLIGGWHQGDSFARVVLPPYTAEPQLIRKSPATYWRTKRFWVAATDDEILTSGPLVY